MGWEWARRHLSIDRKTDGRATGRTDGQGERSGESSGKYTVECGGGGVTDTVRVRRRCGLEVRGLPPSHAGTPRDRRPL